DEVEMLEDNGNTVWYGAGSKSAKKGLNVVLQKDLGRLFPIHIPPPQAPGAPHESTGGNPNAGPFTLNWKPWPTLRRTYALQHQNALGGWKTISSTLSKHPYAFTTSSPEEEGTWTYHVNETNESGESEYSGESEQIKVDHTPPAAPTPNADRSPDYAAGDGWYKDSVTVSFTDNGDPLLADGSSPSGVNVASLTAPQTFNTSGSHTASGTLADKVGNVSATATLAVQVDATPPSLEVTCPATAVTGEQGVHATVTASDA